MACRSKCKRQKKKKPFRRKHENILPWDRQGFLKLQKSSNHIEKNNCNTLKLRIGKEFAWQAGNVDSFPGLGRSPGERNGKMATHSNILAWEIPWTEEPGYSTWGCNRVRHDLATK